MAEHKHTEILRAIADGQEVEFYHHGLERWCAPDFNDDTPLTRPELNWRIKPRTLTINGHEVPEPMRKAPAMDTKHWLPWLVSRPEMAVCQTWSDHPFDHERLARGLCHSTREAAEAHARALMSFTEVRT